MENVKFSSMIHHLFNTLKAFTLLFFLFIVTSCEEAVEPGVQDEQDAVEDTDGNSSLSSPGINKDLLLNLVNAQRTEGCDCGGEIMPPVDPLTWNDILELASVKHSRDMNENNYFSHTGRDGSEPWDRAEREGYNWSRIAENIARGYSTEEDVIQGWIDSPGHCKNIMNPDLKEMGIGRDGEYWTQLFGAPR